MADRYDDRYRTQRDYDQRGPIERAGDEVRSWFGDDEAERRRRQDEMHERARFGSAPERSRSTERWSRGEPYGSLDDGRVEYDRSGAAYRGWNEPSSGYRPAYGYGRGEWSTAAPGWTAREVEQPRGPRGYHEFRGQLYEFDHGRDADDRGQGRFAGRGPKGYARSDQRITEDVCDRLADNPFIDASDIEVTVKNGEVTLAGSVHSRHEKRDTEDLIESISGVRDVHNHLRVERWQPSPSPLGINQASATPTAAPPGRR